jgi:hypothetical protein
MLVFRTDRAHWLLLEVIFVFYPVKKWNAVRHFCYNTFVRKISTCKKIMFQWEFNFSVKNCHITVIFSPVMEISLYWTAHLFQICFLKFYFITWFMMCSNPYLGLAQCISTDSPEQLLSKSTWVGARIDMSVGLSCLQLLPWCRWSWNWWHRDGLLLRRTDGQCWVTTSRWRSNWSQWLQQFLRLHAVI